MTKELIRATIFFEQCFTVADEQSRLIAQRFATTILPGNTRPTSIEKCTNCVVDFFGMIQNSDTQLVSFPTDIEFDGSNYSRNIYEQVKKALEANGFIKLEQAGRTYLTKAVYSIDRSELPNGIRVTKAVRRQNSIQVRKSQIIRKGQKPLKGALLKVSELKKLKDFEEQRDRVVNINEFLSQHPLTDNQGKDYGTTTRKFNNSSLHQGGRLYGKWQQLNEGQRLELTIDKGEVCEIDIKGSYLFLFVSLYNQKHGTSQHIGDDPYQAIRFVANAPIPLKERYRKAAKTLISAMFWDSENANRTRFPKGEKNKDTEKFESFRTQYSLGPKAKYKDFERDIFGVYPMLSHEHRASVISGYELMYKESEIIMSAITGLVQLMVPAYPVHDSLLCKKEDEAEVVSQLFKATREVSGGHSPTLEVTYKDGTVSILSDD